EVDLHVGNASIGEDDTSMRGAGLNADLGQAFRARRSLAQGLVEAVHVGLELFDRRVRRADLADLSTYRDRDSMRLQLAHCQRQLDALLEVSALLFLERRLREIDERG